MIPLPLAPEALREAFGCFPTGVTAVCGLGPDGPVGLAASSFTSVSLEPPLVSVCLARTSTTWPSLRALPRLGVSVLAATQHLAGRALAARQGNRFGAVEWHASGDGAVFIAGAACWLDCSVDRVVPAGDHDLVLFEVHALEAFLDVAPLVFHGSQFRELKTLAWAA
jgi:flavin reductase (DIM6/NTAB) family NADH-FMN oxidoreductase RutF